MNSTRWDTDDQKKKKSKPFPVFRFQRGAPVAEDGPAFPFTEVPNDLRWRMKLPVGNFIRKFFNFLFLFILVIALLGLVGAFGYQLIHNPQVIITWCTQLVESILGLFRSLAQG